MEKFDWSRVAILQQAEEVFISVSFIKIYLLLHYIYTHTGIFFSELKCPAAEANENPQQQ